MRLSIRHLVADAVKVVCKVRVLKLKGPVRACAILLEKSSVAQSLDIGRLMGSLHFS